MISISNVCPSTFLRPWTPVWCRIVSRDPAQSRIPDESKRESLHKTGKKEKHPSLSALRIQAGGPARPMCFASSKLL